MIFDVFHAVDPRELFEHRAHVVRRDALIAARVKPGGQVEGLQDVIFVKFGADLAFDRVAQHGAEDGLAPVKLELDGTARHFCAGGGQRLQDHFLLAAERPAHRCFDGANMAHRHVEQCRDGRAHAKRRLCGRPDGHAVGAGIVVSHGTVRLHGDVRDALRLRAVDELFALRVGVFAAKAALRQRDGVAVLVQLRRVLFHRVLDGEDGGQLFDLELDLLRRRGGDLRRVGQHGGHAVADKADMAAEKRLLIDGVLAGADTAAVIFGAGRVFKRQHRRDAGRRKRGGGVDFFDDPVGDGTEHELHVQHIRQLHVARVAQKAAGFGAGIVDGRALADVLIVHNGFSQNVERAECSRKMRRQNPLLTHYSEPQPSKERQENPALPCNVKKI